jgi:MFS family permease
MITISLYSGTYLTPVFLQNIQRMSALDTGLILFPASLAMAIFMPITGKLYRVVGPIWLMTAGILMIGIGTWKMGHLSVEVSHGYIMFWMAVRNVGISLSTMPATNLGMSDIPRTLSGHASSVNNWIRQGMGSFSIGLFTSLLTERMSVHVTEMSAGAAKPSSLIQQKAFTSSVNDVYFVATVIVLFALPVVAALIRRRRPSVQVQAQSAVRDVQA